KTFQGFLAARFVAVVLTVEEADKIREIFFSKRKAAGGRYLRVAVIIAGSVVENILFMQQGKRYLAQVGGLRHIVWLYAAAVSYLAAAERVKAAAQGVRHIVYLPFLVTVRVVDGLYTAPAGRIVFGGSYFQLGVIGQGAGGLHQAFAE